MNYRVDKSKFGSLGVFAVISREASEYSMIISFFYFLLQHSANSLFFQK